MYKNYYIYMMSNSRNTALYIGVTNDLNRRVLEHKSFSVPGFTQRYCCDKLVYFEEYSDVNQAISREKQLKGWRRDRKDALIDSINPKRIDLFDMVRGY